MNTMCHFKSRLKFWNNMLKEAMLVEGKHWPEDYIKAAINKLKAAGKYNRSKTDADVATIAQRFKPKFHTNSALGYFNSVVRWYSENPNDFIKPKHSDGTQPEDKLEISLNFLKQFLNTQDLVQKDGEKVKQSISLADFSSMMKKISDEDAKNAANVKFKVENRGYKIIPFMSYKDLYEKFGKDKTGYKGRSEWCHTNGESTYDSWTQNYTRFFFVIAKDNWEDIKPKNNPQKDDNAYDEYGLSLMAILVSREGQLLNCTLRWNHVIEPKYAKPGREVDKAFISFAELSQVTGLDVEAEVKIKLTVLLDKTKDLPKGQKVYEGPEGLCFASDHLYWYDRNFNLIDSPESIKGTIKLNFIDSITSLEGCPKNINGDFSCAYTDITSLEGCPEKVGGTFYCSHTNITSLKGCPEEVKGDFICSNTDITSLEGCPEKVGGSFNCSFANITSLEGCPREVGESFWCNYTRITSLKGAPKNVGGGFYCSGTNITSLKGAPAKIGLFDHSVFSNSISTQKLNAYKDWLKTNPKENYPG